MFTGIIEEVGRVAEVLSRGSNRELYIEARMASELVPEQSVSHNGVCLTVEEVQNGRYRVTVIGESLSKSALGELVPGSPVNLERCLRGDARLDGHFVQGHVDARGQVLEIVLHEGSRDLWIGYPDSFGPLVVPRGSLAVQGISLTVADLAEAPRRLKVSIIPFTLEHTNLGSLSVGDGVNLEFDVLGKYVVRFLELRG